MRMYEQLTRIWKHTHTKKKKGSSPAAVGRSATTGTAPWLVLSPWHHKEENQGHDVHPLENKSPQQFIYLLIESILASKQDEEKHVSGLFAVKCNMIDWSPSTQSFPGSNC